MSNTWSKVRRTRPQLLVLVVLLSLIAACDGAPAVQNPTAAPAVPTAAAVATSAPAPTSTPATTSAPEVTAAPPRTNQPNASAGNPEPGTSGGTMTGAWVGPCCVGVDNVNPLKAGDDYHWLNKIYSHLVTYDVGYTGLMGDLAEKWSVSEDNLTWTFNLRKAKWHDGSDVTADDVAFSIELCLDPKAGGCNQVSQLTTIKGAQESAQKAVIAAESTAAYDACLTRTDVSISW